MIIYNSTYQKNNHDILALTLVNGPELPGGRVGIRLEMPKRYLEPHFTGFVDVEAGDQSRLLRFTNHPLTVVRADIRNVLVAFGVKAEQAVFFAELAVSQAELVRNQWKTE